MNIKLKIISFLLILLTSASAVFSQDKKEDNRFDKKDKRELFYTFIGPVAGFGGNYIWYRGWENTQQDYSYQGMFVKGGIMIDVFAKNFSGDFTIEYNNNMIQPHPAMGLFFKITGKYVFKISDIFNLALGVGGYFETPPSDNPDFKGGAGVQVPFGMIINTTQDTKLILDFYARFGYYGFGVGSLKVSYGMAISFLFKVGTL